MGAASLVFRIVKFCTAVAITVLTAGIRPADAFENGYRVEIEAGAVWQSLNDARIPGRAANTIPQGTLFSLKDLQGSGPSAFARISASYTWGEKHQIHLLYAPLTISGTGAFATPVLFQGQTFAAGLPVAGRYRFDSYRIGYRYKFFDDSGWKIWGGATLKVRDANIALAQGNVEANRSDTGIVPLLSLYAVREIGERWSTIFDVQGLAAPQGRAIDAALKIRYQATDSIGISAGYRMLEGGADNRNVYTFAWLHYALVALDYQF